MIGPARDTTPRGAATTRLAAGYLAAQGVAVAAWWALLLAWPPARGPFELGDPSVLRSFLLPDVGFGLASLLAARLVARGRPAALAAVAVTTGAVGYSTAMTLGHVAARGEGVVGAVAMVLATAGSALCLRAVSRAAR
ncbi:hypothetical protein [Kineococcus radiotolerans]|uniref:hypothetical protein n=1 Tax=Kineococcus radiotolerans TaxID=131568 RepID=UPI0002D7AD0D|nr:hypothetical protein [Kineococcus radiotolerans]